MTRDTIGTARPVHGPSSTDSAVRGDSRVARVQQKSGHREAGMATAGVLGFIGLGVMGEPMCRNLARKSGATVVAFDERPAPLAALAADGVQAAASTAPAEASPPSWSRARRWST
jgi:hypothetical protein